MRKFLSRSIIFLILLGATYAIFKAQIQQIWSEVEIRDNKITVNAEKSFTFVVLPDTQKYSAQYKDIFCAQTNWIVENIQNLNIVFVSQLGDIVDNGGRYKNEWTTASSCMGMLEGKVPYGIIPGNHDSEVTSQKESGFATYNATFPVSRFDKYPWYGGNFNNYQNNYQLINALGTKFLFLNLEIEPSDEAIAWAQKIVKENTDSQIIVTTHKYLPDDKDTRDNQREFSKNGNSGEDIWKKLIYDNCSISFVFSGHYHNVDGENILIDKNKCGENVYQTIQDYQSRELGGNGRLRLYVVTPEKSKIEVLTYSPYTNEFENDRDSKFTIPFETD